jgi:rhodanese-related sulfurtransferase
MTKRFLIAASLVFFMLGVITPFARSAEAPRITMEKLKEMMGSPDLILIDVRTESDWKGTDLRMTGAVREDPNDLKSWAQKYPKDKTLVLYCA